MRQADNNELVAEWIFHHPPLIPRQKVAMTAAAVFCILSSMVCAPMGGSGGQTLFDTDNNWAYWPFFFLSPILIFMLCARALHRWSRAKSAPSVPKFEPLFKPEYPLPVRIFKLLGFLVLSCVGGSINAYNAIEYLPRWLSVFCFLPALFVTGYVMVTAMVEFHKRIFLSVKYILSGRHWREQQSKTPERRLVRAGRQYRQLDHKKRCKVNAFFSHPYRNPTYKLQSLFNPLYKIGDQAISLNKSKIAYTLGILGFVVGTFAELYSYSFGRKIAKPLGPVPSIAYGLMLAYVRMGISAITTSDTFSDLYDDAAHFCRTRKSSMSKVQTLIRIGIAFLAVAAAMPNVQNQIKTMGREGPFGHFLSICAMIAPACTYFWAGDMVFHDWQYDTPGLSYRSCYDTLFSNLSSLKDEYYQVLPEEPVTVHLPVELRF